MSSLSDYYMNLEAGVDVKGDYFLFAFKASVDFKYTT